MNFKDALPVVFLLQNVIQLYLGQLQGRFDNQGVSLAFADIFPEIQHCLFLHLNFRFLLRNAMCIH